MGTDPMVAPLVHLTAGDVAAYRQLRWRTLRDPAVVAVSVLLVPLLGLMGVVSAIPDDAAVSALVTHGTPGRLAARAAYALSPEGVLAPLVRGGFWALAAAMAAAVVAGERHATWMRRWLVVSGNVSARLRAAAERSPRLRARLAAERARALRACRRAGLPPADETRGLGSSAGLPAARRG